MLKNSKHQAPGEKHENTETLTHNKVIKSRIYIYMLSVRYNGDIP